VVTTTENLLRGQKQKRRTSTKKNRSGVHACVGPRIESRTYQTINPWPGHAASNDRVIVSSEKPTLVPCFALIVQKRRPFFVLPIGFLVRVANVFVSFVDLYKGAAY
jgi:hypothetical protein